MGITDYISEFFESVHLFQPAYAEAPPKDDEKDEEDDDDEKDGDDEKEDGDEKEGGDDEEEGGDDEEEDEPEDPKPKIEEECQRSKQCAPLKHHYEECAQRVMKHQDEPKHKGPKEDCVEEFFHLAHCTTQCAAPRLWAQLK